MSEPVELELRIGVPVELTEEEKKLVLAEIQKTSIRKVIEAKLSKDQRIRQWNLVEEAMEV